MIHLRRIPVAATALVALSVGLPAAESRIVLSQGAPVEITRSAATGTVSFLRVADGEPLADLARHCLALGGDTAAVVPLGFSSSFSGVACDRTLVNSNDNIAFRRFS